MLIASEQELSEMIIQEISDPRLSGISITDVRIDRELAYADVYYSCLEGSERAQEILEGLKHARGYLRRELALRVDIRTFPRLRFHYDPTFERAERIERLIASLHEEESPDTGSRSSQRYLETMTMVDGLFQQVGQQLLQADNILVVSHIRPDGDAVGSLLGLGLVLRELGKNVQMVLQDGIPSSFKHLDGSQFVQRKATAEFDLVCVLDCSDLLRAGNVIPEDRVPDINLDHHATNLNFARLNVVLPEAVATTEVIAGLIEALGWNFSESVSAALLTGLITDTIGFRTSNITPDSLRLAARLMESGAELSALYHKALINQSFEAAQLWGMGLSKLNNDGRIVWTSLTQNDRQQVKYPGRDDADLINVLSSINGYDVALIFVEQPNGNVKVSWRSQPTCDVSGIALEFGGGGHPRASGAEISGSLQEVQEMVLQSTSRWIESSVEFNNS